ncbi:hypothetical protein HDU97_007557 [Phlyctochytrium planicorne]|nr:hypothetical protein HDU97_007557 [Phlyctochytrium planicorne]
MADSEETPALIIDPIPPMADNNPINDEPTTPATTATESGPRPPLEPDGGFPVRMRPSWTSSSQMLPFAVESFDPNQLAKAIEQISKEDMKDIRSLAPLHMAWQRDPWQGKVKLTAPGYMDLAMVLHDGNGYTPLHLAASGGFLEGCRMLLKVWKHTCIPARKADEEEVDDEDGSESGSQDRAPIAPLLNSQTSRLDGLAAPPEFAGSSASNPVEADPLAEAAAEASVEEVEEEEVEEEDDGDGEWEDVDEEGDENDDGVVEDDEDDSETEEESDEEYDWDNEDTGEFGGWPIPSSSVFDFSKLETSALPNPDKLAVEKDADLEKVEDPYEDKDDEIGGPKHKWVVEDFNYKGVNWDEKNENFYFEFTDDRNLVTRITPFYIAWMSRQFHITRFLLTKMKEFKKMFTNETSMFGFTQHSIPEYHQCLLAGHPEDDQLEAAVKVRGKSWATAFHLAANLGFIDLCKRIHSMDEKLFLVPDGTGCLPIHVAAATGHLEIVQWMLELDPRLLNVTSRGDSLLHFAAGTYDISEFSEEDKNHAATKGLSLVQYLVKNGLNPDPVNQYNASVYNLAAATGNLPALKFLVEHFGRQPDGPNPWKVDEERFNWALTPLFLAAEKGFLSTVKYLVEVHHADPLIYCEDSGWPSNPMLIATAKGQLGVVKYFLEEVFDEVKRKEVLGMVYKKGYSLLGFATLFARLDVIDYLLGLEGTDVNQIFYGYWHPLTAASETYSTAVVKRILDAKPRISRKMKFECLSNAITNGYDEALELYIDRLNIMDLIPTSPPKHMKKSKTMWLPTVVRDMFYVALKKGNLKLITFFLDGPFGTALKKVRLDSGTALLDAISTGDVGLVSTIARYFPGSINREGDITMPPCSSNGFNLFMSTMAPLNMVCALDPDHFAWATDMAKLLIHLGADVNLAGTDDNKTPLLLAVEAQSFEMVKMLVEDYHVDVNLSPDADFSALSLAVASEADTPIAEYLIDHGATIDVQFDGNHLLELATEPYVKLLIERCPSMFNNHPRLVVQQFVNSTTGKIEENLASQLIEASTGNTVLHAYACIPDDEDPSPSAAYKLIRNGTIHRRNKAGQTALMLAILSNCHRRALDVASAERYILNHEGFNPGATARDNNVDSDNVTMAITTPITSTSERNGAAAKKDYDIASLPSTALYEIVGYLDMPSNFLFSCQQLFYLSKVHSLKINYIRRHLHSLLRAATIALFAVRPTVPFPISLVSESEDDLDALIRRCSDKGVRDELDGSLADLEGKPVPEVLPSQLVSHALLALKIRCQFAKSNDMAIFTDLSWLVWNFSAKDAIAVDAVERLKHLFEHPAQLKDETTGELIRHPKCENARELLEKVDFAQNHCAAYLSEKVSQEDALQPHENFDN